MILKNMILFCRKWVWLLLLGLGIGLFSGFIASRVMPPVYEGSAKVMVTRGQQGKTADTVFMDDVQLILTYVELPTSQAVLSAASQTVGFPIKAKKVRVVQIGSSQVLEITVQNSNPEHAASMANAIVQGMIDQNKNLMADRFSANEKSLQARIEDVQGQMDQIQTQFDDYNSELVTQQLATVNSEIDAIQKEISSLQAEIIPLSTSLNIQDQQDGRMKQYRVDQLLPLLAKYQQIKANLEVLKKPSDTGEIRADSRFLLLQSVLDQYRQIYLNLMNNLETARLNASQYTPNVVQIESSIPPEKPIRPVLFLNTLLAGVVGLVLACGGALLIDYFQDTLNYPGEIESFVDAPNLGSIPDAGESRPDKGPLVLHSPSSETTFAVQSLVVNLELMRRKNPFISFLVTAAEDGEGITFTAVNLAAEFALYGYNVILIDGNIKGGRIHDYFKMSNNFGLTDLIINPATYSKTSFSNAFIPTLAIIPSGELKEENHPLSLEKTANLIARLEKKADLIIIDAPPMNMVDTLVLASAVDGALVLIRPHHTQAGILDSGLKMLKNADVPILGTVLSRIKKSEKTYYG